MEVCSCCHSLRNEKDAADSYSIQYFSFGRAVCIENLLYEGVFPLSSNDIQKPVNSLELGNDGLS